VSETGENLADELTARHVDGRRGHLFDVETLDAGALLPECLPADYLRAQLDSDAVAAVALNRITLPRR
jgi:hypothetical protein